MKNNMTKSKILEFLVLTFFITWICWGIIIIANRFGYLEYGTAVFMILFLIGGNGPPIASYILQKKYGEIDGLKTFFKLNFNFRASIKDYGLVLLLLLIHFLIPIALVSTNRTLPIYYGFLMIPVNLVGGGLEEIGWRGILQPSLEKLTTFTKATIAVAIIWMIWHLPLWFIVGTFQSEISFIYFGVAVMGMAFSLAAIKKTTSNTFLCIFFHSTINSFCGVFMLRQNYSTFIIAAVEIILAIVIIYSVSKYKKISLYSSF